MKETLETLTKMGLEMADKYTEYSEAHDDIRKLKTACKMDTLATVACRLGLCGYDEFMETIHREPCAERDYQGHPGCDGGHPLGEEQGPEGYAL